MTRQLLYGWGRTAPSSAEVVEGAGAHTITTVIREATGRGVLARGLGRSYGDAAQNGGGTVLLIGDSVVEIDDSTGIVRAGAGVSFDDLIRRLLPRGLFVPVTPGTRQITVGGAIAADVHGKNHHADGSWGNHLLGIRLPRHALGVHERNDLHVMQAGLGQGVDQFHLARSRDIARFDLKALARAFFVDADGFGQVGHDDLLKNAWPRISQMSPNFVGGEAL